jgi:hypothetical protein
MIDRDLCHGSYPGGVKAAECHGIANERGGAMNEQGGLPKGDPVAKKIGKVAGKMKKKEPKAEMKGGFGKKVAGK